MIRSEPSLPRVKLIVLGSRNCECLLAGLNGASRPIAVVLTPAAQSVSVFEESDSEHAISVALRNPQSALVWFDQGSWEQGKCLISPLSELNWAVPTMVFLPEWREPPQLHLRDDGKVLSFAISGSLAGVLRTVGPGLSGCYQAASVILSEHVVVGRLLAWQTGAPNPHTSYYSEALPAARVVIPHSGPIHYLRKCLQLIEPTSPALSIHVCIDDSLSDGHSDLMRNWPSVHWYRTEVQFAGPYVARHLLGTLSAEPVVLYQDSDDCSTSDRFMILRQALAVTGSELIGSHVLEVDEIAQEVRALRYPLNVSVAMSGGPYHAQLHPTTITKRDSLLQAGGFSTVRRFASDTQFLLRAATKLQRISNVDRFLYIKRHHSGSLTTSDATGFESCSRQEVQLRWRKAYCDWLSGIAGSDSIFAPEHPVPMPGLIELQSRSRGI